MEPVLERTDFLCQAELTLVMVVADYWRCHLAPLREQARSCWVYTGPQDITRTQIGTEWDLDNAALRGLLRVVTGVDDLGRAELPWKELALCPDPNRVALQASLPKFDAQGLVDRPGRRNPGTIQIPWVDEATSRAPSAPGGDAAGSRPQSSGKEAAGGLA